MSSKVAAASVWVARLRANTEAWCAGIISYDTFSALQSTLWAGIQEDGPEVKKAVLAALRLSPGSVPSTPP